MTKILYMGTPEIAARCLEIMLDEKLCVTDVFTQPDRPAGRGMKLRQSAVAQLAERRGIAVHKPVLMKKCRPLIEELAPDMIVVCAYGRILPDYMLEFPKLGCINMHASLLPRWRGAAPIQRAIMAGDTLGGVSTMHMASGIDAGDVIFQTKIPIEPDETGGSLHDKYADAGGRLLVKTIVSILREEAPRAPQDLSLVTYAPMLDKSERTVDWRKSATEIVNHIRAFNPYPSAQATLKGQAIKLHKASVGQGSGTVGHFIHTNGVLEVAAGNGSVVIEQLQPSGKRSMTAAEWLAGNGGDCFDVLSD